MFHSVSSHLSLPDNLHSAGLHLKINFDVGVTFSWKVRHQQTCEQHQLSQFPGKFTVPNISKYWVNIAEMEKLVIQSQLILQFCENFSSISNKS